MSQVRDHTLWDDQLGLAVLQHPASKTGITMGYTGVVSKCTHPSANIVAYNVSNALQDHVFKMVKESQLTIPGYRGAGAEPSIDPHQKPTYKESQFTLCAPRSNGELPLHQHIIDEWNRVQAAQRPAEPREQHTLKCRLARFCGTECTKAT